MARIKHSGNRGRRGPGRRNAGRQRDRRRPAVEAPLRLWGRHAVQAALDNPLRPCLRLLATTEGLESLGPAGPSAPDAAADPAVDIVAADRETLDGLVPPGAVHQGLVLEAGALPAVDPATLTGAGPGVLVLLDRISDPRNLGAVLRSARAFGARGVIVPDRHAPPASGTVARAAAGALETVPLVRVANVARMLERLAEEGFWRIGLEAGAEGSLADADAGDRVVLVLGEEGSGLRRLTREHCDFLARIPIRPEAGSLNLSNAAAIALYEVTRSA